MLLWGFSGSSSGALGLALLQGRLCGLGRLLCLRLLSKLAS